ncbi:MULTISPECIES: alpha/beta fold hydrolase [Pseudomonas]|uniref:2-succinyl-6-hydroxy-2, 4-cyclohexadiene-1-carboxylate synthase n=1 Tax=Pseudomonas fluorescens TaxID=294 RepID=A0A5E6VBI9_PSEFL|nr:MULTISPECIES: alpha/beta fold hydrolase [Pseudomonas]VVN14668.1 2-succinyl-6-hydroxy-2, 4-cyclohexadiene-1-carboxylate synthase [Pseudomonas fluorescens]
MLHATDHSLAGSEAQLQQRFPQRLMQLADGAQAIREAGQGPAIVLLHGIGSGAASWLQVALQLSQHARVIAWDAPGYGDSSPLAAPAPQAADYARRLLQLLDALHIDDCLLVGHSLGALSAAALAYQHPQRLRRLVLISPARGYGDPARAEQAQQVRSQRLHNLEQLGIAQMARQRSAHMLSPAANAEALAWVQWNMARLQPQGYRQAIELLCGDDLLRYAALTVPCEVHCGGADSITRPEDCQALAKALGAAFALIAGAGHASPIEQPEAVASLLARALEASLTGTAL